MDDENTAKCAVCLEKVYQYTCPRCNLRYCSVACYKHLKHADCSELFYRDCFFAELRNQKVSSTEKQAILETIKKVEKDNPILDHLDEEYDLPSLEERLQNIDMNNFTDNAADDLWSKLTSQEQEEFKQFIQHGFIPGDIDFALAWKPWWLAHSSGLVTPVDEDLDYSDADVHLPNMIKVFHLSSDKPISPFIGFNLINVLYPYVFFQRIFNGCGSVDFDREFSELCLSSSRVLSHDQTYPDAEKAICQCLINCLETAQKQDFHVSKQFLIECVQDVSHVLIGPSPEAPEKYSVCALSDLHFALKRFRKSVKRDITRSESKSEDDEQLYKRLFAVMKKLEFLASWSTSHSSQLPLLSMEVSEIYRKRLLQLKQDSEVEKTVAVKKPAPPQSREQPLIAELG